MTVEHAQNLADDHVHSTAGSADARATVDELCRLAVSKGLTRVCFTEHLDFDRNLPEYGYYIYANVKQAIEHARVQFSKNLEITMGLEVDFEPRFADEIPGVLRQLPVDFVLGSVHVYQGMHFARFREIGKNVLPITELADLYRSYFSDVRAMIRANIADSIAHLDYPAKVSIRAAEDAPIPGYDDELAATLELAVAYGVGLEINTKRSRAGAPLAAPASAVMRYIQLGGNRLTLGSDTHGCEQLADGLEIGKTVLKDAGLNYQTVFRQRQAERLYFS